MKKNMAIFLLFILNIFLLIFFMFNNIFIEDKIILKNNDSLLAYKNEIDNELPIFIKNDIKYYGIDPRTLDKSSWDLFKSKLKEEKLNNQTTMKKIKFNSFSSLKSLFLSEKLDLDLIEYLIDNGMDINKKDEKNMTPLAYLFSKTNSFDRSKIESLVNLGANLYFKNNEGLDILNMALSNENREVRGQLIEYLREKGISFSTSDNPEKYLQSIDRRMKNSKYINEIVSNISDVNAKLPNGNSAFLHLLFMKMSNKNIEYFLDNYVDVTIDTKEPYKVLHAAIMNGRVSSKNIERIIDMGADINQRTSKVNATPLMTAAYEGDIDSMKILLKYGANINLTDAYNRDVYYYANLIKDEKQKNKMQSFLAKYKKEK
ncbi:ankyrin repeat domain-containing protein [Halarcobacter sp.]|uniref:ankyrin repeat domain-containing protein n=1 Tax=Halarcobacter sp. TaxID=2321133 RepID=UPI002AAA97B4|nr:ankyrin repeat domain-containing protein [Halarcobacter sp.]